LSKEEKERGRGEKVRGEKIRKGEEVSGRRGTLVILVILNFKN
jgi:hypothetical protein